MSQNTDQIFPRTSALKQTQISTGNTNRDGTGTLGTLVTGGADGTRIDRIRMVAAGTTTAGVIRIFLDDGSNVRLIHEQLVTAITPGTTQQVWSGEWSPAEPIVLPDANWIVKVSTHNAETFNVFSFGGHY